MPTHYSIHVYQNFSCSSRKYFIHSFGGHMMTKCKLSQERIIMARKEATSSNTMYPDAIVWNEKGKLNTGDKIEGYYLESNTFDSKFGPFTMFIVKSVDGQIYKISGQSDIKKKFANIPEGVHVWIEYVGLTETEQGAKKTYKIEYDDEDVFAE